MQITGVLNGLDGVLGKLEDLKKKSKAAEVLGVKRAALMLRDTIVKYSDEGHPDHPMVQTGRLRSSIKYKMVEGATTQAYVGSDAKYAPFVEFGHGQTPGRFVPAIKKKLKATMVKPYPFVRPAITDVFDGGQAQKLFEGAVKEKLGI